MINLEQKTNKTEIEIVWFSATILCLEKMIQCIIVHTTPIHFPFNFNKDRIFNTLPCTLDKTSC